MLELKTLDKVPIGLLQKCFVEVMAGNPNASKMTPEVIMRMNTMRGVEYRSSICALDGGRMVAFILNSVGIWGKKKTAYNVGTGVIQEYRATSLSKDLILHVKEVLKKNAFHLYMLDVGITNDKARELYRNIGFEEVRNLTTMVLSGRPLAVVRQSINVEEAKREKWMELRSIISSDQHMIPSWLNEWDNFYRMPEIYSVNYATMFDEIAGVVIFTKETGEIHQLWVSSQWKASGIGSALMAYVAENSKAGGRLVWHNIDTRNVDLINFLRGRGFADAGTKAEMAMEIFPQ
ncbi:MAG: GNAT family N-acetyltransferase [Elusimicrobiales bacterium]|nr:GNAT family N-acetyltransferase [Elusimicrobiales bacterium]